MTELTYSIRPTVQAQDPADGAALQCLSRLQVEQCLTAPLFLVLSGKSGRQFQRSLSPTVELSFNGRHNDLCQVLLHSVCVEVPTPCPQMQDFVAEKGKTN